MAGIASLHGKTFLASMVLLFFGGAMAWRWEQAEERKYPAAEITVEHRASFGLNIAIQGNPPLNFAEIGNDGSGEILLSLPDSWERREVRNVPLLNVVAQESGLGYTRWKFPPNAHVTFRSKTPWSSLIVHNPSKIPFKIILATIDLKTHQGERDIILVKDRPVTLP